MEELPKQVLRWKAPGRVREHPDLTSEDKMGACNEGRIRIEKIRTIASKCLYEFFAFQSYWDIKK